MSEIGGQMPNERGSSPDASAMKWEQASFSRLLHPLIWAAAIAISLVLLACNVFLGDLNQDEGWYLYAARLVSQGKLPYLDFATTQGPVMPFVYALAQPIVDRWGVTGGRLFTALLGFICSLSAIWLASRLAPVGKKRGAALIAFCLVALNVHQSYFCAVVKTYSLAALFIMLGFVALSFMEGRRGSLAVFLSGILLALAGGTRTSAGVVLPLVFVCLLINKRPKQWFWFGLGGGLTCCIIFVPFMLRAPAALRFALFDYHAGRDVGGLAKILAYKAGFVSRVVQAYFVAIGIWLTAVLYILVNRRKQTEAIPDAVRSSAGSSGFLRKFASIEVYMWLGVLGVTMVHFCAPFPYDDYQVLIFPLFAVAVGGILAKLAGDPRTELLIVLSVFLLCVASAFSSPINQKWFVDERDRIWWPLKDKTPLMKLGETAECLRKLTKPGDMLLTQDPYLAIESGLSLPPGLEMGPFSCFPGWTRERAAECHVLNGDMMNELLTTCNAPVAAFSGYGFAIQCPSITRLPEEEQALLWRTLEGNYELFRQVEKFGQADTTLRIYRRR